MLGFVLFRTPIAKRTTAWSYSLSLKRRHCVELGLHCQAAQFSHTDTQTSTLWSGQICLKRRLEAPDSSVELGLDIGTKSARGLTTLGCNHAVH